MTFSAGLSFVQVYFFAQHLHMPPWSEPACSSLFYLYLTRSFSFIHVTATWKGKCCYGETKEIQVNSKIDKSVAVAMFEGGSRLAIEPGLKG